MNEAAPPPGCATSTCAVALGGNGAESVARGVNQARRLLALTRYVPALPCRTFWSAMKYRLVLAVVILTIVRLAAGA